MAVSKAESSVGVGISTGYKSIKVEGAGSSGANGIYKYKGTQTESYVEGPLYSKIGVWKGEAYEFFIYQSFDNWYIMVDLSRDGVPTRASTVFKGEPLYFSRHSGKDLDPTCEWTRLVGQDPPPQVATQEEDPLPRTSSPTRENDESRAVRGNDNSESSSKPNCTIDVEGALVTAVSRGVNGTYKYGGYITHAGPWFSKSGEWMGENRIFFIYRTYGGWFISVSSDGACVPLVVGDSHNGQIIYSSPLAHSNKHNFPPTSQWRHKMFDSTTSLPRITVRKESLPRSSQETASVEILSVCGNKRHESSSSPSPSSGSIHSNEAATAADGMKRKGPTVVVDMMALEVANKSRHVLARQKDRLRKDIENTEQRKREEEQRLERLRMDIEETEKRLGRLKREEIEVSLELQEADDSLSKLLFSVVSKPPRTM